MISGEEFDKLPPEKQIEELTDEMAFRIARDTSIARLIEKAVNHGFDVVFMPSTDPVDAKEINIRLMVRENEGPRRLNQNVFIRTDIIGLVN